MKIGDFFTTILAAKLGLQNDPALVSLLSNADFAQAEIDDTIAGKFNTGLMSLEGAKANNDLQKHFKASALNGVDAQATRFAEAFGITDAIAAEQNTFKKLEILQAKMAEKIAEAAKKGGSESEAVKNLTKQNEDLQFTIRKNAEAAEAAKAELLKAHQQEMLDMLINSALASKNYANKQLDTDVNVLTARTLLNQRLAAAKAIAVNEGGKVVLKQAENPSMNFVDEGFKDVAFGDFVNKTLADAHLLAVAQPTNPNPLPNFNPQQQQAQPNAAKQHAAVASALADLGGAANH